MIYKETMSVFDTDELDIMTTDIIYSENLTEFSTCFQKLATCIEANQLDSQTVMDDIFHNLEFQCVEDISDVPETRYQIMTSDSAVRLFLYADWVCEHKNKSFAELGAFLASIDKGRQSFNSESVKTKITQVLNVLASDTTFFEKFPQNHILNIAVIDQPKTHYCGHLTGSAAFNPDYVCHPIVVSAFTGNNVESKTVFEFMRALGYVFLFSITDSHEKVPAGFLHVLTNLGIEMPDVPWEAFAECFAVSLCMKNGLQEYDPYLDMSLSAKQRIYDCIMHFMTNDATSKTFEINAGERYQS